MIRFSSPFGIAALLGLYATLGHPEMATARTVVVPTLKAPVIAGFSETTFGVPVKGKATVFVFLAMFCPCSQSHETVLTKLSETFSDFQFVGVHSNFDEPPQAVKDHYEKLGHSFPVIDDVDQTLANRFGALKTPHVFVVSKSGEVLFEGGIDDSRDASRAKVHHLESALVAIRKNEKPNPARVRTLGCPIPRRS